MRPAQKRPHFLQQRCAYSLNRFPWATLSFFVLNVVTFYGASIVPEQIAYSKGDSGAQWRTVWSYAFFHVDAYHLWSNMVVLLLAGSLLEATDANARMVVTTLCAIPCSAIGHGLVYGIHVPVVGFSGVVYAVLAYQFSLLAKNWKEMRCRPRSEDPFIECRALISSAPIRLCVAIVLVVVEVSLMHNTTGVSHGGHGFGALSGFFVGLAIGSNVYFDWWECVIPLIGIIGHLGLVMAAFASMQVAGGTYGLLLTIPVALFVVRELNRWGSYR